MQRSQMVLCGTLMYNLKVLRCVECGPSLIYMRTLQNTHTAVRAGDLTLRPGPSVRGSGSKARPTQGDM